MSVTKQRLIKVVTKGNSRRNNTVLDDQHEYITAFDESSAIATDDDDAGDSIAYIEDYEIAGHSDDAEGDAFFVEYVTEDEDNSPIVDGNNSEQQQLAIDYDDDDDDGGDGGGGDAEPYELYNCSTCGMNFHSVTEHIEKHHPEQDVLIDISDEAGPTAIKTERALDLNDDTSMTDNDDGDAYITSDTVGMMDGELIVYGGGGDDESLEDGNDNEIVDVLDENNDDVVYSYDESTGQLTRATTHKANATKIGSNIKTTTAVSVQKPLKRLARNLRDKPNITNKSFGSTDHICEICNTAFYSAKSLKLHARMHLPVKSKTMDEACDMEADMGAGSEQEQPREKFYCGICGKHYDKTFELVHMQMHNGEEKFNCAICNKVFPNAESLKMHSKAHSDPRNIKTKAELKNIKLPYGCRYCEKEFARPHEKVKHERVHTGEKPYECELCGKCFRVSYCLTIHMRTHTDARPYVCETCQKRFKAQSVYNHHLLTHSDARNYKCPYCPKTFKTSVQLSGHKNSHTKPFTCTECNRPFGSLYAVRAHMESHKRPNHNLKHICDICGAKYARRFALNDHMKEQHKDCQFVFVDANSTKKAPAKRSKKGQKQIKILDEDDEDERELEAAGQSILPNMVEQEITISEIEHFDNEEEVVEMDDWLK